MNNADWLGPTDGAVAHIQMPVMWRLSRTWGLIVISVFVAVVSWQIFDGRNIVAWILALLFVVSLYAIWTASISGSRAALRIPLGPGIGYRTVPVTRITVHDRYMLRPGVWALRWYTADRRRLTTVVPKEPLRWADDVGSVETRPDRWIDSAVEQFRAIGIEVVDISRSGDLLRGASP